MEPRVPIMKGKASEVDRLMELALDCRDAFRRIAELSVRADNPIAKTEALGIIYGISGRVAGRITVELKNGPERQRFRQPRRHPEAGNVWDLPHVHDATADQEAADDVHANIHADDESTQ